MIHNYISNLTNFLVHSSKQHPPIVRGIGPDRDYSSLNHKIKYIIILPLDERNLHKVPALFVCENIVFKFYLGIYKEDGTDDFGVYSSL